MSAQLTTALLLLGLLVIGLVAYNQKEASATLNTVDNTKEASSGWKVIKGKRNTGIEQKGKPAIIDDEWIEREADGFTMIWERATEDRVQSFICRGSFGEFQFWAKRWDLKTNMPTDRYTVFTKYALKDWPKNNEELILAHKNDIESGLLHFPYNKYFYYKPVKAVSFDTVHTDRIDWKNSDGFTFHDTDLGKYLEIVIEKNPDLTREEKGKLWAIANEKYAQNAKKPHTVIEGTEFPIN